MIEPTFQPTKTSRWRPLVQAAFLLLWLAPLRLFNICGPVFHCYACPLAAFACPVGMLAQFSAMHAIPFVVIGTLGLVGVAVGGFVCGWACPFGFLQDLAARISPPRFDLPGWLSHFRYVVLFGLVLLIPWFFGTESPLFFCRLCPISTLEVSLPELARPNAWKLGITIVVVAGMFLIRRPWCRVLCPLGLIFGWFNRIAFFGLRFDNSNCAKCQRCPRTCDYGAKLSQRDTDTRCIRCLDCMRCKSTKAGL